MLPFRNFSTTLGCLVRVGQFRINVPFVAIDQFLPGTLTADGQALLGGQMVLQTSDWLP
jgi:uncharacterized protein YegL